jgi:sulfite reductase beta subunit-like hemoprotein
LDVARNILIVQRDNGNRKDRKVAFISGLDDIHRFSL